jgi:small-conductance mechanosensitive channel
VRSEVNIAILKSLKAAGVEIPYPQRVLRFEGPVKFQSSLPPPLGEGGGGGTASQ